MNAISEPNKRTFDEWWSQLNPRRTRRVVMFGSLTDLEWDNIKAIALEAYRAGANKAEEAELARRSGVKVLPEGSLLNRVSESGGR